MLGRSKLYSYCEERAIPHSKCGKLVVATNVDEISILEKLLSNAHISGVTDCVMLSEEELRSREPDCTGAQRAFFSPSTGVVDAACFVSALEGEIEDLGGSIAYTCEVTHITRSVTQGTQGRKFNVSTSHGELLCDAVVNSAGLYAPFLDANISKTLDVPPPKVFYAKGNYFRIAPDNPKPNFQHLIYPLPPADGSGLGIHATLDLGGGVKFGPDVQWLSNSSSECTGGSVGPGLSMTDYEHQGEPSDFNVDCGNEDRFYQAIRSYYPALKDGSLEPDYSGIRPKLICPESSSTICKLTGRALDDFIIEGSDFHKTVGLVNLFGIESPGLTSSLSLGEEVLEKLLHDFDVTLR
jgi:L-2-hydroxyglutarate oxidase LhgO